MINFRLFGIPVTVQPLHWLILALFGGITRAKDQEGLLLVALFMLAGFFSILVHEFGHALTGRKFGTNPEVILHGMGGVAVFPHARFSRWQSILVTAAGPAIQLVLAALALAILIFGGLPETLILNFFSSLFLVSLFWALLNLIPVYPMDGGQIMFAILGPARRTLALQISIVTAIVGGLILFKLLGSYYLPILMAFMAFQN